MTNRVQDTALAVNAPCEGCGRDWGVVRFTVGAGAVARTVQLCVMDLAELLDLPFKTSYARSVAVGLANRADALKLPPRTRGSARNSRHRRSGG